MNARQHIVAIIAGAILAFLASTTVASAQTSQPRPMQGPAPLTPRQQQELDEYRAWEQRRREADAQFPVDGDPLAFGVGPSAHDDTGTINPGQFEGGTIDYGDVFPCVISRIETYVNGVLRTKRWRVTLDGLFTDYPTYDAALEEAKSIGESEVFKAAWIRGARVTR